MNLHAFKDDFENLSRIVGESKGVSTQNIKRDYFIVLALKHLVDSEYGSECVFKGGTSLSKCYPGSINRFSEDIDLTFVPNKELNLKGYDKALKRIEEVMSQGLNLEKIPQERNSRNKSSWIWPSSEDKESIKVKLEIGSSVRPDPYSKRKIKTFIQEYLESKGMDEVIKEFGLCEFEINTLNIERTFLDKVMSVKRHAQCGSLSNKIRHLYDVVSIFNIDEVQEFLSDRKRLKNLIEVTKQTDSFYLEKRGVIGEYDPTGLYDFESWKYKFDSKVESLYNKLPNELLFDHNIRLDFKKVIATFEKINQLFIEVGE